MLGAGVMIAEALYAGPDQPKRLAENDQELLDRGFLETPAEFLLKQTKLYGHWAPSFNMATARVPWDPANPPFTVQRYGSCSGQVTPSDIHQAYVNAKEHQRRDAMEQMATGITTIARQSGQPIWGGFTPEVHDIANKNMKTQHMQWVWLPRGPTDSDFADAAAMSKAIPANPLLWTPDAWFATAPGLPFRYSY